MLNKQVKIYSVEGNYFYNKDEQVIYKEKMKQVNIMKALERFTLYNSLEPNERKYKFSSYEEIKAIYEMKWNKDFSDEEKKLYNSKKYIKRYFTEIEKKYYDKFEKIKDDLKNNNDIYMEANKIEVTKAKELEALLKVNNEVRRLNTEKLTKYDMVSLFDSNLTRIMNLEFNKLSKDLLIVEITQYIMMEQLIDKGFDWESQDKTLEHYVFLTASAGQIRKQKIVMIKETVYDEIKDALTCGLTLEIINQHGGANVNKYLAYLSLNDSATDVWEEFNIDEAIVIPDFEADVTGEVDFIGTTDVERTFDKLDEKGNKCLDKDGKVIKEKRIVKALLPAKRDTMTIKITHSDGCGWIHPSLSKVSFMVRLPWVKGLLVPVNYISWCDKFNGGNCKVTDIYGKQWDLKEDNIKVVFTESQFKMWKFYNDWDDYKKKFKDNKCKANKCNEEPKSAKEFKKARFNYQMLQTLVNMTEDELKEFINPVSDLVKKAYTDREIQLKLLGAFKTNRRMANFQKALLLYPALLKDKHVKEELSDKITAIKNEARQAKFSIDGTYTFLLPDIFAWMEFVFKGEKNLQGLLDDGQVFCNIYKTEKRLLVNRSPHCYAEHAVRENYTGYKEYKGQRVLLSDWFITNGVYTSTHDLISKLLQNDYDGDRSLVIKGNLVDIADREMKAMNVVPLYYEMSKAPAEIINSNSIIKSLKSAFRFGNIGKYSNKLSKIWNSETKDIETAKMLTALNNFYIDGAKTNYCPEVYSSVRDEIKNLKKDNKRLLQMKIKELRDFQNNEKERILSSIENKEEKKVKRAELSEKYNSEVAELRIKLKLENEISAAKKKEELLKDDMQEKIKIGNKSKLPYFFRYAKDMQVGKVEEINASTVNKACKLVDDIPQKDYNFGDDKFNWHYLANNFKIGIESEKAISIIEKYELLNNQMKKYFAKAREDDSDNDNVKLAIAARVYTTIRQEFEEFTKSLDIDMVDATDIIVRYIYKDPSKKNQKKAFLFDILGDIILKNLKKNIEEKTVIKKPKKGCLFCSACGKEAKRTSNRQTMCTECSKEMIKAKDRKRKAEK